MKIIEMKMKRKRKIYFIYLVFHFKLDFFSVGVEEQANMKNMNVARASLIILTVLRVTENVHAGSFTSPLPFAAECGYCAHIYNPVCANNGETYYNECEFYCVREMAALEQNEGNSFFLFTTNTLETSIIFRPQRD